MGEAISLGSGAQQKNGGPFVKLRDFLFPLGYRSRPDRFRRKGDIRCDTKQAAVVTNIEEVRKETGIAIRGFHEDLGRAVSGVILQSLYPFSPLGALNRKIAVKCEPLSVQPRCH